MYDYVANIEDTFLNTERVCEAAKTIKRREEPIAVINVENVRRHRAIFYLFFIFLILLFFLIIVQI